MNGITQFGFPSTGGTTLFFSEDGVDKVDGTYYAKEGVAQEIGVPHSNGRNVLARFDTGLHAASDWGPGGRVVIGCYTDVRTCKHFLKYDLLQFDADYKKVLFTEVPEEMYNARKAEYDAAIAQTKDLNHEI